MDVISFDQAVSNTAIVIIAAQVHTFARAVCMMNVVAQDLQAFIGAA